jgi:hypothetical protein
MPGTGGIHEKYPLEGEYSDAHAQFQGIYGEMKTTLQANILHRLNAMQRLGALDTQEADDLAELFQNLDAVLDKDGAAAARDKLLPLIHRVASTHPKLPELIDALDVKLKSGRDSEWRRDASNLVTFAVHAGVKEGTTDFEGGLRLLMALDRKIQELDLLDASSMRPIVSGLTEIHLGREDIKITPITGEEFKSTREAFQSMVSTTVTRIEAGRAEQQERTVHALLERCQEGSGQGRGKLSEAQADVVTQWLATKIKAGSVTPEEQGRVLRLFTEEALPAQKFMEMAGTLDWLSYGPALAQLAQLVTAAEKLEHTAARAMRDYKIPAALFFHMTQDLAEFVSCHPESASKDALKDRVQAMEDRHSLRLGGVPQVVAPAAP